MGEKDKDDEIWCPAVQDSREKNVETEQQMRYRVYGYRGWVVPGDPGF